MTISPQPQQSSQVAIVETVRSNRTVSRSARLTPAQQGVLFVLPAILVLVAVLVLPISGAIVLSFFDATPRGATFAGLENFNYLLERPVFWTALGNTIVFTAVSVAGHLALGLATALLVNERIPGRTIVRVALLIPWVIAPVIVGVTWKWIFDPLYGMLNSALLGLGIISDQIVWLGTTTWAMPATLVANAWHGYPFMMVMLLAGLQAIPEEEYEAAKIDGANAWHRFRYITMPNLRYIVMIGVTLDTIVQFRAFDLIQVMTGGGPVGATEVLSTLVYREMFANFRFGLASAIGTAMFVITTLLSLLYIAMIREDDE